MLDIMTAIFCDVDDFCNSFEAYYRTHLLPGNIENKRFFPKSSMALYEIMTIVILFHLSQYRTFKWFIKDRKYKDLRDCFPHLVSYNRFEPLPELMGRKTNDIDLVPY